MEQATRLEARLAADAEFSRLKASGAPAEAIQARLDEIAPRVCAAVGADALVEHMDVVYGKTANTYATHADHLYVPDALLLFTAYLEDGASVLDLGCGSGRDAVFLALRDAKVRERFMGRMKDGKSARERFGMPFKSFRVIGVDRSLGMIIEAGRLAFECGIGVAQNDQISLEFVPGVDMHHLESEHYPAFDGIWSSAALFMHTPEALIAPSINGVARALVNGGVFGVSYANNQSPDISYDNLRYSRTGEVKYFSRPTPWVISIHAEAAGLVLCEEVYDDLVMGNVTKKDFFVTQFFEKRRT